MATIENAWSIQRDFTMLPNSIVRSDRFTPRAFRVLAFLMSHEQGWRTSTERIGKTIGMSAGTVKSAVNDLVELGYLRRVQEHREKGRFGAMTYILVDPTEGQKLDNGTNRENESKPQVTTDSQKTDGGKTASGKLTPLRKQIEENQPQENQKNTPPNPPEGGKCARPAYPVEFEGWWWLYPRRVGKAKAFKAWERAVKQLGDARTLMEATRRFADWHKRAGTELRYIPHPTTWLNRGGWDDELPALGRAESGPSFFDFVDPPSNGLPIVDGEAWGDVR